MTRESFLKYVEQTYGTEPDYPFDDGLVTAVLRHRNNRKWFAVVMEVPRCKFGQQSSESVDVVNLKLPTDMFGSFNVSDGVYPAYHMNKLHWVSVLLPDAEDSTVDLLTSVSYEVTRKKVNKPSSK